MAEVVYVKLLSGEDIIAKLTVRTLDEITLAEPLTLESGVDETDPSRRYVYMSRFSPYARDNMVTLRLPAVSAIVPASMLLERYYEASLNYCKKFSDELFVEGITATTDCLEQSVTEEGKPKAERSEPGEKPDFERSREIWQALLSGGGASSNTHH